MQLLQAACEPLCLAELGELEVVEPAACPKGTDGWVLKQALYFWWVKGSPGPPPAVITRVFPSFISLLSRCLEAPQRAARASVQKPGSLARGQRHPLFFRLLHKHCSPSWR